MNPRSLACRPRLARDLNRVSEVYESSLCLYMFYFSCSEPTTGVGTNNSLALSLSLSLYLSLSLSLTRSLSRTHTKLYCSKSSLVCKQNYYQ
jgi:hypothetical protein